MEMIGQKTYQMIDREARIQAARGRMPRAELRDEETGALIFRGYVVEPMPERQRVYFMGAHSTGKSTLAQWVSNQYGLPLIPEVARRLLRECKTTLNEVRMNPDQSDVFQLYVFQKQLEAEAKYRSFVSDRGCDHLAYAVEHARVAGEIYEDKRFTDYMASLRADGVSVFLVRPHRELLVDDGVRAGVDWDSVQRIDAMTQMLLQISGVQYIEIASKSMCERTALIEQVLEG